MSSYRTKPIHCKDCGILLTSHRSEVKRCKSCARREQYAKRPETHPMLGKIGELAANFKDGRSLKQYYCIDCRKEISWETALKGGKRCKKCSDIAKTKFVPDNFCQDCGIKITIRGKRCKSCSRKEYLFFHPMPTGKDSCRYIHGEGYAPYPLEFSDILKESIRTRDNHECQNCGMTEEEHLIVYGRIIQVHHIDYNKKNCKEENLITLCQGCNIRANFNRKTWQEFYMRKLQCQTNV